MKKSMTKHLANHKLNITHKNVILVRDTAGTMSRYCTKSTRETFFYNDPLFS